MPTETEIKLRAPEGAAALRARIEALGYREKTPRELERDQLYDRSDEELRRGDQILRLRTRGSRSTLTYKGPAQRAPYKSREELETDIADGKTFEAILFALGYRPAFRYEKYRTTFADSAFACSGESGLITIDETPIGDFLELEGDPIWIDTTALKLGYSQDDYLTESYATLYRKYCVEHPEAVPTAMAF